MKRFLLVSLVISTCSSLGGCGDGLPTRVQVTGKVFFQGQPLHTGTISFSPKAKGATRPSLAFLHEDGTFKMTTFRAEDGVQPGDYDVAIIAYDEGPLSNSLNWTRTGKKLIPEKYFTHATSGLKATIPDHDVELEFKIE
jgi:hypothetical protein